MIPPDWGVRPHLPLRLSLSLTIICCRRPRPCARVWCVCPVPCSRAVCVLAVMLPQPTTQAELNKLTS